MNRKEIFKRWQAVYAYRKTHTRWTTALHFGLCTMQISRIDKKMKQLEEQGALK